ncbi:MAG: hypothetical protein LBU75_02970 [Desulfovibrio sp.]|jgi:Fe-S-cluster containining protein|nr:hypothetical protein [Desulfovibrio sp.]
MSAHQSGRKPAALASTRISAAVKAAGRIAAAQDTASLPQPGKPATRGGRKAPGIFARLAELYADMERTYAETAHAAGLTCADCEDNCCRTHFQHHTHVEWAYLWKGMLALPEARRAEYLRRAHDVVAQCEAARAAGVVPRVMCPVNDDGLCGLYAHRLMICRMHGTRNVLLRPDGQRQLFRGCHRFCGLTDGQPDEAVPTLDRTPFYRRLAELEMEHCARGAGKAGAPRVAPRVSLTLAEMLVYGPPKP